MSSSSQNTPKADFSPKKHLITSALPYANGPLHIGHLAGAYLSADIYARFLRLRGEDVVFVCGSDEHGAAITIRAKKEGISPKEIVDKYDAQIKNTFERLGVSFDIYHRTSDPIHHQTAQDFFLNLAKKGEFEQKVSEQYYDETYHQFLADRYIIGTCPSCENPNAYGDQCEKCGSTLSPLELINPRSTLSGNPPVLRETTHWYFLLDKHTDWLRTWTETGELDGIKLHDPAAWKNHVLGQCRAWLGSGDDEKLLPRAITRDLDWGIKVPTTSNNGATTEDGKVLYVWFDAPIGYISATKALGIERFNDANWWKNYWQNPDCDLVHFIGKDNIVFHCIIFPAMLKAHGDFNLPKNVPANQFMNLEGDKISTSRNWAVWVHEYLDDFASLPNAADTLRYAMIKGMPETKDSNFNWADFRTMNDSELVGTVANSINRVVTLLTKYYGGVVPTMAGNLALQPLFLETKQHLDTIEKHIEAYQFREALAELLTISRLIDGTLQTHEPWKLYKQNPENPLIKDVLGGCLQLIAALSVAAQPFLPVFAEKLRHILNLPRLKEGDWHELYQKIEKNELLIAEGHQLNAPEHLFTRIDESLITQQIGKLAATKQQLEQKMEETTPTIDTIATTPAESVAKTEVSFDDFSKIDLRTGVILAAETVKKADKLLKLTIDLGNEQRTVVSGIAQHYAPESIIGQQVVLLANLAPRKMRGIESNGMILMAENAEGKLVFVQASEAGFGGGWQVR